MKFMVYPQDHEPRHVHAFIGGIGGPEVIIDLKADGTVAVAARKHAAQGATRSEVRKALIVAERRFADLALLWETMHDA